MIEIDPMTVNEADELLKAAYDNARNIAGVVWEGQTLEVAGEPAVVAGIDDTVEEQ